MDIFQERGHQADVKNKLSVEQLHGIVGNYDGMVIRSATKVCCTTVLLRCHSRVSSLSYLAAVLLALLWYW